MIPVDSIFSPVRRVSYEVEAARVGQRTDYDKLALDITTDGSHRPRKLSLRRPRSSSVSSRSSPISRRSRACTKPPRPRARSLRPAGWRTSRSRSWSSGVRSYNCLKRVGIETIGDLGPRRARPSSPPSRTSGGSPSRRSRRPSGLTEAPFGRSRSSVRHHKTGRKLGRDSAHRKALYANLCASLIEHGRIKTTEAKAKEVRPVVEQLITLGKRGEYTRTGKRCRFSGRSSSRTSSSPRSPRGSPTGRAATRVS